MHESTASRDQTLVSSSALFFLLLTAGLALRLWMAHAIFLNPDEALHYLLSVQPSLAETYQATLSTAHPPLYIVFLHYWGYVGHSEFFLRLPSVAAYLAFCGMMFLWLEKVATRKVALLAFGLLLFSPALVYLSTELRQYPFLLFFCSSALYFLERACLRNSLTALVLSGLALWLALLTHYSALFFTFNLGLYGLSRIWSARPRTKFIGVWVATQFVALAIVAVLLKSHILRLLSTGQADAIADTYLRGSIFHRAQDHAVSFVFKTTIRLFHFFFSQEVVGIAGLLLFVYAVIHLWRNPRDPRGASQPSSRQIAFLLAFPLILHCTLALAAIYPYGGTRHDSYLAIFVISGIAMALARWTPRRTWIPGATIAVVLLVCNLFPAATGQFLTPRNQSRQVMQDAVNFLSALPPGSIIFTDNQGGLLLSYYLCDRKVVLFDRPYEDLFMAPCGDHQVVTLDPRKWIFQAATFPDELGGLQQKYNPKSEHPIWVFQAGWLIDKEPEFRAKLRQFGCPATYDFGRNILVCQLNSNQSKALGGAGGRANEFIRMAESWSQILESPGVVSRSLGADAALVPIFPAELSFYLGSRD